MEDEYYYLILLDETLKYGIFVFLLLEEFARVIARDIEIFLTI